MPTKKNHLFISWGGEEAHEIATWLVKEILPEIPETTAFFSPLITPGAAWRQELDRNLKAATHCLGIMTDTALRRPWFLYEIFTLRSRGLPVPLLSFSEVSDRHPLADLQRSDGHSFDSIVQIAKQLLENQDGIARRHALNAIEDKRTTWEQKVSGLAQRQLKLSDLRTAIDELNRRLEHPGLTSALEANDCMRQLALKSLQDIEHAFRRLGHSDQQEFDLDLGRYPEYLIHLQKSLNCNTEAVAVVDEIEEFWAQQTGQEILRGTHSGSKRVFVFRNEEALKRYWKNLQEHRIQYNVFVISRDSFDIAAQPYGIRGDFSVLTARDSRHAVTAYYENSTHSIRFSSRLAIVSSNHRAFEQICARAVSFPLPSESVTQDDFVKKVFSMLADAPRYHSDVIPIQRYDAFEEDHPFYRDMQSLMLSEFRERAGNSHGECVLEIGAGTGHFTKRLAQQPSQPNVTALEPDPKARKVLSDKLSYKRNVAIDSNNALDFNSPVKFSFVFSAFSEHHIKPAERSRYFGNILGALNDNGFFIVGDEFLPPHDGNDEKEYETALAAYHQYIIGEATKAHHTEVAELERSAWDSGRSRARVRVDYKVTVDAYVASAKAAGFKLIKDLCVSPKELSDAIGGIHMLVFQKAS